MYIEWNNIDFMTSTTQLLIKFFGFYAKLNFDSCNLQRTDCYFVNFFFTIH